MRQIILCLAVSLDGYIEGPQGEYDWCLTDQDYGMNKFLKRTDSIFMGRKSYEAAGGNVFPEMKCYVFSNSLKSAPAEGIELVSGDVVSKVHAIKARGGKDIWLWGGAVLTSTFINANLVDEMMLAVHPLLLGSGKPLFQDINGRKDFKLVEAKTYDTGLVMLYYKKK